MEANRQMLAEDTLERREKDRETIEAWYKPQGVDRRSEVEGARERLLAKLEARSKWQKSRRAGGATFRARPPDGESRTRKRCG